MRELKYKAYDLKQKKYLSPDKVSFYDIDKRSKIMGIDCNINEDLDDCDETVMFLHYSGAKDKHGAEIYELDIVRTDSGNTFIVIFKDYSFKLKVLKHTDDRSYEVFFHEVIDFNTIEKVGEFRKPTIKKNEQIRLKK